MAGVRGPIPTTGTTQPGADLTSRRRVHVDYGGGVLPEPTSAVSAAPETRQALGGMVELSHYGAREEWRHSPSSHLPGERQAERPHVGLRRGQLRTIARHPTTRVPHAASGAWDECIRWLQEDVCRAWRQP